MHRVSGDGAVLKTPLRKHRHVQPGDRLDAGRDHLPFQIIKPLVIPAGQLLKGRAMNMHTDIQEFDRSSQPKKVGFLGWMLGLLIKLLSGAKGDQGGWEGGARGL